MSALVAVSVALILAFAFTPAAAQDRVTVTDSMVGCVWSVQKKVFDYAVAKDEEAIRRLWAVGVLTGACHTFSRGDVVIVLERSLWYNMARVKLVGATSDYWVAGQLQR